MDGRLKRMHGERTNGASSLHLGYSQAMPVSQRGRAREISALYTDESVRGEGYATRLLHEVCFEADMHGLVLVILPDTEQLAHWYARFGFALLQNDPLLMARPPRH